MSLFFKQLSDASRLRIFWLLCHCEACGTELAAMVDITPPAVSHHLRLLRSSHLLVSRREGKEVYYRASDSVQAQALHHMIERMLEIFLSQGDGRRSPAIAPAPTDGTAYREPRSFPQQQKARRLHFADGGLFYIYQAHFLCERRKSIAAPRLHFRRSLTPQWV